MDKNTITPSNETLYAAPAFAEAAPEKHSLLFKIWRVLYPLFIFVGVQIAGSIVLIIVYAVTVIIPQLNQPGGTVDMTQLTDWVIGKSLILALACDLVVIPVFAFLYIRQIKGQKKQTISSFKITDYLLVAALAIAADFAVTYILIGFNLVQYFPDYQTIMSGITGNSFILQIAAVGIIAPIAEEFLMRGVILNRLLGYVRVLPAVLIQAVLFGVLHMNILQGTYAAVLGILMGYIYIKYGSLLMTIIFHITLNTLSVCLPETFAEGVNPFYILIPALILTGFILWLINHRGDSVMFYSNRKLEKVPEEAGE